MNKRIAKKVLSTKLRIRRMHLWRLGYGPEIGDWPIETRARAYLDRRLGRPYRRAQRVLRLAGYFDTPPKLSQRDQATRLIAGWGEHRPFIWRAVRHLRRYAGESIAEGRVVGERELSEQTTSTAGVLVFALHSLSYFSDRWCISRMGRMDAYVDVLRRDLPALSA